MKDMFQARSGPHQEKGVVGESLLRGRNLSNAVIPLPPLTPVCQLNAATTHSPSISKMDPLIKYIYTHGKGSYKKKKKRLQYYLYKQI